MISFIVKMNWNTRRLDPSVLLELCLDAFSAWLIWFWLYFSSNEGFKEISAKWNNVLFCSLYVRMCVCLYVLSISIITTLIGETVKGWNIDENDRIEPTHTQHTHITAHNQTNIKVQCLCINAHWLNHRHLLPLFLWWLSKVKQNLFNWYILLKLVPSFFTET